MSIEIKDLNLDLGDFKLKDINIEIEENQYFVLLGKSGSGKTTLLESIAGLYKYKGSVIHNGISLDEKEPEDRNVGFVYQDFALFPNLNVKENITFADRYKTIEDKEALLEDLGDFLGINHIFDKDVNDISGGEKQRVAIARAIYSRSSIFLLDEPLSAIDPTFRNKIMKKLRDIHKRYNLTTIHVTHNFREASYLADKLAIMINGKVVQMGEPREVLSHPKTIEIAKFLGFKNIINTSFLSIDRGYFSIDPNNIQVSKDKNLKTKYLFKGVLEDYMGVTDHYKLYVRVNNHTLFIKVPAKHASFEVDEELYIGFDDEDIGYIDV